MSRLEIALRILEMTTMQPTLVQRLPRGEALDELFDYAEEILRADARWSAARAKQLALEREK